MKPVDVIENESERDQEHYEGEGDGHLNDECGMMNDD